MVLAKKIRIKPNKIQEKLLYQSAGTARFIYNWTLGKQKENYENGGKFISDNLLELSDISLGIDLGIKDLAVISNGKIYKNINKKKVVKKLKKKLKRLQKQVSRKYEKSREVTDRYDKSQNIVKLEKKIRLVHRRISNIRNNNLHVITNEIVKTKPSRIVME
ncbi:helix-turn-helix domain-containing protein, partial [Cetobacterium sp.]|uniref:helix-turn-helix domain-containing protein n=1 Tax=Cetobacterium sp. TaxID=2071632 RepID=UPI003F3A9E28